MDSLHRWLAISDGGKGLPAAIRRLEILLKSAVDQKCTVEQVRDVPHLVRNAVAAIPNDIVAAGGGGDAMKLWLKSWAQITSRDELKKVLDTIRLSSSREAEMLLKMVCLRAFECFSSANNILVT